MWPGAPDRFEKENGHDYRQTPMRNSSFSYRAGALRGAQESLHGPCRLEISFDALSPGS